MEVETINHQQVDNLVKYGTLEGPQGVKKETAENYNYKLEEKKEIQQIYQNAKGNILNSKVSIEKEDLKKIATKAIEVTKIDLVLDKYKQENKELKKENLKLTNNNRFLAPYVNKSNELRQENSMLEKEIENLKTKIISLVDKYEKEINKQKEKLNNFLTEHNFNGKSLVHYFKKFEKKEKTAETKERNLLIKAQKQQEIAKKKEKEKGFER